MAHHLSIENGRTSMMYVGEVPWHGLGTRLETAPRSAAEAIEAAGLDWEVGLKRVYAWENDVFHEIPDRQEMDLLSNSEMPPWSTTLCLIEWTFS